MHSLKPIDESPMKRKRTITKSYMILLLAVASLSIVVVGGMAIQRQYSAFHEESERLRKNYIETQKNIVKKEVEQAVLYLEWRKSTAKIPEKELQKEVLQWLSMIRFPNLGHEEGILFVRSFEGMVLMSVSLPELVGENIAQSSDPSGINTHRLFMNNIKNPQGGFAEYSWYNPFTRKMGKKLTFVKGVPEWQWYIGAGFWFDDINTVIEQKKEELKQSVRNYIALIAWAMAAMLAIIFASVRWLSAKMGRNFLGFASFFDEAATQSAKIDLDKMSFPEFETLASSANRMIEEREQSREKLRAAFEKRKELEEVIARSFAVAFRWRNEEGWPVDYVSENILQFGFEADEFTSGRMNYAQFVHDEDLPRLIREIKTFTELRPSDGLFQEYRVVAKDGRVRWVIDHTWLRYNDQGEITHYQGIMIDVTERKEAEASLCASEEKFRKLFENSPDAIAILSADGLVMDTNRACLEMLGYRKDEIIGTEVVALFADPSDWDGLVKEIEEKSVTKNRVSTCRKKDGTLITCLASALALRDETGRIIEIQCITRDITEQQNLEQQFLQAQKMESVGRLAGGVAHDFNNMLSVIMGRAELLLMGLDQVSPIAKGLTEIQETAQRSVDLTRQLLTFARKQAVLPVVLNMNEKVAGVMNMLRRLIGEDIELVWNPGNNLFQIRMDVSQVDQILANLCVNARDAIDGVGKVTIETRNVSIDQAYSSAHIGSTPGEYLLLTVSDNGCGMDKETMSRIFEPFFTTKESGRGTGLGLATVYGIVRQNGGFIHVYSEPGLGTTFRIYLPRHIDTEALDQTEMSAPALLRGDETILIAEDEQGILDITKALLEDLGYTVHTAASAGEAVFLAKTLQEDIHLLITDVIMPEMNGKELSQIIREMKPRIKVLFMSGYTADVIARHGVLDEGVSFLQKPFTVKDLSTKIRAVLK